MTQTQTAFHRRKTFLLAAILVLVPASTALYLLEQDNFHPITEGVAYRSAQLNREEFTYYVRKYGIRSIVNLRGYNAGSAWYDEEIQTSKALGVNHYDLSLSAQREPLPDETQQILRVFREAPRPVLIHCRSGADRSGLVAAMWRVVVDKESKATAKDQLSLRYGHFPVGRTAVLDRFFEKWEP